MPPENWEDAQAETKPQGAESEEVASVADVTNENNKQGGARITDNAAKKRGQKRAETELNSETGQTNDAIEVNDSPMVQSTSAPSDTIDGTKGKGKKKHLVSYSSQDSKSSIESTTSRRSGRKRTAVTKMGGGGVMIDQILKGERKTKEKH